MAQSKIRGTEQIMTGTVTSAQVDTTIIQADGLHPFTGAVNVGTHLVNNVVDPVSAQDAATKAYVDARTGGTGWTDNETPSGAVNGSNTHYLLAHVPALGWILLYLNGLRQEVGAGNDYVISGGSIDYIIAPATGDKLRTTYMY